MSKTYKKEKTNGRTQRINIKEKDSKRKIKNFKQFIEQEINDDEYSIKGLK